MERCRRGRVGVERILVRQHGIRRGFDLAAREICRTGAGAGIRRQRRRDSHRGPSLRMSASIAKTPAASKLVLQDRSCEPNSAECLFSRMFAMAADIALPHAHSESWSEIRKMAARSSAHFATTGKRSAFNRLAPKPAPRSRSSSGNCRNCASKRKSGVAVLHERGMQDAVIYDPCDTSVGGTHAMFIVRGDPRTYNLPPAPEVPTSYLKKSWRSSAIAAGLLLGGTLLAFLSDLERR